MFEGVTDNDKKLWHSYFYWARQNAIRLTITKYPTSDAIIDDDERRIDPNISTSIQTIIFSAFTLEYRLRRVRIALNAPFRKRDTLRNLLESFWDRLTDCRKVNGEGNCEKPEGWEDCSTKLMELVNFRNKIAHANYEGVLRLLAGIDPEERALEFYNAVVDAIKLINIGTGHDKGTEGERELYYSPLYLERNS